MAEKHGAGGEAMVNLTKHADQFQEKVSLRSHGTLSLQLLCVPALFCGAVTLVMDTFTLLIKSLRYAWHRLLHC